MRHQQDQGPPEAPPEVQDVTREAPARPRSPRGTTSDNASPGHQTSPVDEPRLSTRRPARECRIARAWGTWGNTLGEYTSWGNMFPGYSPMKLPSETEHLLLWGNRFRIQEFKTIERVKPVFPPPLPSKLLRRGTPSTKKLRARGTHCMGGAGGSDPRASFAPPSGA